MCKRPQVFNTTYNRDSKNPTHKLYGQRGRFCSAQIKQIDICVSYLLWINWQTNNGQLFTARIK